MGSNIEKIDEPLETLIQEIFEEGRKKYGTRPIQAKLLNSYGITKAWKDNETPKFAS